jgi:hypothetical protein
MKANRGGGSALCKVLIYASRLTYERAPLDPRLGYTIVSRAVTSVE